MSETSGASDVGVQGLLKEAYNAVANGDPTQALRLVLAVLHATGGQAAAAPALNRVLSHLTANNQDNALQELTELFARAASVDDGAPRPPRASSGAPFGDPSLPLGTFRDGGGGGGGPPGRSDSMSCSGDEAPSAASASFPMDMEVGRGGLGPGLGPGSGPPIGGGPSGGEEAASVWMGPGPLGPQLQEPILSETGREGFMECALADGSSYLCGRCRGVVLITRRQQHDQFWCQGPGGAGGGAGLAE